MSRKVFSIRFLHFAPFCFRFATSRQAETWPTFFINCKTAFSVVIRNHNENVSDVRLFGVKIFFCSILKISFGVKAENLNTKFLLHLYLAIYSVVSHHVKMVVSLLSELSIGQLRKWTFFWGLLLFELSNTCYDFQIKWQ